MVVQSRAISFVVAGLVISVTLTGCRSNDYGDSLNLSAGDAIARNKAVQTIDPWPRHSFRKYHGTNGARISKAYGRYEGRTPAVAPKEKSK